MSVEQPFTSSAIVYEPQDLSVTQTQNAYLRVAPRVYDQALTTAIPVRGVFAYKRDSSKTGLTLAVVCVFDKVWGSGTEVVVEEFDATSGAYLRQTNLGDVGAPGGGLSLNTTDVSPGRFNELWFAYQSSAMREFVAGTWEYTGENYLYSAFTPAVVNPWVIDTMNNRLVSRALGEDVLVYNLATGALLATIPVGGVVLDVFLEDLTRCYVVTEDGLLVLVDYVAERVLSVGRIDFQAGTLSYKRFGWDRFYKRVLTCEPTADNADGSSTTIIRGYYPLPLGTNLMPPIPLKTPRDGRNVPLLTRCFGNAGEPIGGVEVTRTIAGDGSISAATDVTDSTGYALFDMVCDNAGSTTVDLTAEQ